MNQRYVRAYVSALGLCSVYVIALSNSAGSKIGHGSDPKAALKRAGQAAQLAFAGWCSDESRALMVVDACHDVLRDRGLKVARGEVAAPPTDVSSVVVAAADEMGVVLQSADELACLADDAVGHIEREFDRMLRAGELRVLNRRYKVYRLAQNAAGKGAVSYPRWIADYKATLIRLAAAAVPRRGPVSWPTAA